MWITSDKERETDRNKTALMSIICTSMIPSLFAAILSVKSYPYVSARQYKVQCEYLPSTWNSYTTVFDKPAQVIPSTQHFEASFRNKNSKNNFIWKIFPIKSFLLLFYFDLFIFLVGWFFSEI